jgi:hypothetical protein
MNNNLPTNINPETWGTVIDKYYKTNEDILYQHCVIQTDDGLVFKVISHHDDDSNFLHHHVFLFKQGVEILQFKDKEIKIKTVPAAYCLSQPLGRDRLQRTTQERTGDTNKKITDMPKGFPYPKGWAEVNVTLP